MLIVSSRAASARCPSGLELRLHQMEV